MVTMVTTDPHHPSGGKVLISGRLGSEESPTDIPGCADKEGGLQLEVNQSYAQVTQGRLSSLVPKLYRAPRLSIVGFIWSCEQCQWWKVADC